MNIWKSVLYTSMTYKLRLIITTSQTCSLSFLHSIYTSIQLLGYTSTQCHVHKRCVVWYAAVVPTRLSLPLPQHGALQGGSEVHQADPARGVHRNGLDKEIVSKKLIGLNSTKSEPKLWTDYQIVITTKELIATRNSLIYVLTCMQWGPSQG